MGMFVKAVNQTAYAKVTIFGKTGAGKTYTASEMAIGLAKMIGESRIAAFETEPGTDFLLDIFKKEGIDLLRGEKRTKSFHKMIAGLQECIDDKIKILLIDSISHVWEEFVDNWLLKQGIKATDSTPVWAWKPIKQEWRKAWIDPYLNAPVHVIACGRSATTFVTTVNEFGKTEMYQGDEKVRAEREFGNESSLFIEMLRVSPNIENLLTLKTQKERMKFQRDPEAVDKHVAHVLKDRSRHLDGQSISEPKFEDFLPYFQSLNIGGAHVAYSVDQPEKATEKPNYHQLQRRRAIAHEQFLSCLTEIWPGSAGEPKQARNYLVEIATGKPASPTYVENDWPLEQLELSVMALDRLRNTYQPRLDNDKDFAALPVKQRIQFAYQDALAAARAEIVAASAPATKEEGDLPL